MASEVVPERTVLFFGSGSSLPSGAPSVVQLEQKLSSAFNLDAKGFSLAELASLVDGKVGRKPLIAELRKLFVDLKPTGGLLNLPLYSWKSLFTTNYDELIEQSYARSRADLTTFDSDFDFTMHGNLIATNLFKIHGTIGKDISDGHVSRIILSDSDYDHTEDYREQLFNRFKSEMAGSHVIIIGHSLTDNDVKAEITRAISLNALAQGSGKISLLLYTRNDDRASLYEKRGIQVCFGGIDEFFAALAKCHLPEARPRQTDNPLDKIAALRPVTVEVQHSVDAKNPDVSRMFNGWPANYAEIGAGLTFERSVVEEIDSYLNGEGALTAVIIGASGVGKTTAARQIALRSLQQGKHCWEHRVTCPCKFPPRGVRVRPSPGRTDEASQVYGRTNYRRAAGA
ncbi:SIR2 family NAD-dependent protein deacylase [Bradyrhizobium liaoningense]